MNKYRNLGQDHLIIDIEEEEQKYEDSEDDNEDIGEDHRRYHFGYMFHYGTRSCSYTNGKNQILRNKIVTVVPRYSNLQEELTQNKLFCQITQEQFKQEYKKAALHSMSRYKKKYYSSMKFEHILALMFYCNYDRVQYDLSKTYRENKGIYHCEYYYWGKYLKQAIKDHGTRMHEGKMPRLYHGVNECLSINLFIPNMQGLPIACPLSTTSCYSVAFNFTNQNNGLVFEFSDGSNASHGASPRYFSVAWLSDFSNESEYLFIQNDPSTDKLIIHDIINPSSGISYHTVIYALYMKTMKQKDVKSHNGAKWREEFRDENYKKVIQVLKKDILEYEFNESKLFTDKYTITLIDTYIQNGGNSGKCARIAYCFGSTGDRFCTIICWTVIILIIVIVFASAFGNMLLGNEEATTGNVLAGVGHVFGVFWKTSVNQTHDNSKIWDPPEYL